MPTRTNTDWIEELTGSRGSSPQRTAHEDLARYLYVVAYNYLLLRQGDLTRLAGFAPEELAALAQDFVQETLEKLARGRFALLDSFHGAGKFTSWVAQIVRNQAAMELRKSHWTRAAAQSLDAPTDEDPATLSRELADSSPAGDPAHQAQQSAVRSLVERCLDRLSERYRLAVLNCLADDISAEVVARELNTTANAVYLIIQRAKRQLRTCLEQAGLDRRTLALFS